MTITLQTIQAKKNKEKITMLTAYAASTARLVEASGVDIILVGDSLGMVFQGKKDTLSVTIEEMIYHTQAVRRGAPTAFVVVDMPFMSYQVSSEQTLINAGRIMKETGANAVKVEGASAIVCASIKAMVAAGIPVMGHLGFTPQSVNQLSGYKVQGRDEPAAQRIKVEAKLLLECGVFSLVLEMVPAALAGEITKQLPIPTISCGAGPDCDGQVLVVDDALGLYSCSPRFAKKYIDLNTQITAALSQYVTEVKSEVFPGPEHSF